MCFSLFLIFYVCLIIKFKFKLLMFVVFCVFVCSVSFVRVFFVVAPCSWFCLLGLFFVCAPCFRSLFLILFLVLSSWLLF